jgi:DNA-damage-inducible protein D
MVDIGSSVQREIADIKLSRYACYLIAQNGDPRKQEISFAQAYFAVQTRKAELIEQKMQEMERLRARKKLTITEKEFQELCYERGVDGDGIGRIRSKGDAVLFGGKTTQQMKEKLGVKS